jgi:hypothetical protein
MILIYRAKCSKQQCKKNVKFLLATSFKSVVGFAPVKRYDLSQKIGFRSSAMRSGCGGVPHRYAAILALAFCGTAELVKITIG